ncbi:substrate-binding periplasmic protein [Duganella callida]|uniref:ABC transporter substrate-binding protein n=1 Tax=Duganella callida TaxID=2561932 RepID=A0A4Y9S656_9BURK|nr:ABC transporter substrate-binding protein [Duganella callida]TFW16849.1 ABC transporter substrate-binding protein [Duganella callida]
MSKRLITAVLVAWLPLAGAQPAGDACPPARVGVSDLGYSSYRDGGVIRGTNIDVLNEIQRRSGCSLRIGWYPRGRLYAQFYSHALDLTGASLRSPERDRHGIWLPYTYTRFELVLLNQHAGQFASLADFVNHSKARLNVTRGIFYTPETQAQLDRLQRLGRLEYVNDYSVVFRKIVAGRAEGTLAPATIHLLNQRQFGLSGKMSAAAVSEAPRMMVGIYVSHQVPPAARQKYADAIRGIVTDGTMQRIYEKYLGAELTRRLFGGGTHEILEALP